MDNIKFGNLIAQKRKELGLTQKELAGKLHITDKAVSKWETGKGFPDLKLMEPLAEVLGITVYELFDSSQGIFQTPVSAGQNSFVELQAADQVVRDAMDYFRTRKKKTVRQKVCILLLILIVGYIACSVYDIFIPGRHVFTGSPAQVYEEDGSVSGEVKVTYHGKLKNCLLPFHGDNFMGTVQLKMPEMEYGEIIYVWLTWQNDTAKKSTGGWLLYPQESLHDELLSTMQGLPHTKH